MVIYVFYVQSQGKKKEPPTSLKKDFFKQEKRSLTICQSFFIKK